MSAKPVLVLHPEIAHPATKKALRSAGYVVVVAENPEHVRVVEIVPEMPSGFAGAVFRAAMKAIAKNTCRPREDFGAAVTSEVQALMSDAGDES